MAFPDSAKWNPIFAWFPVKTLIYEHRDEYYQAINQSNAASESTAFIEFMLQMVRDSLKELVKEQGSTNVGISVGIKQPSLKTEDRILFLLKDDNKMTTQGIADTLGTPKRQIERIIAGLMRGGKLERVDSGKAGHWA